MRVFVQVTHNCCTAVDAGNHIGKDQLHFTRSLRFCASEGMSQFGQKAIKHACIPVMQPDTLNVTWPGSSS